MVCIQLPFVSTTSINGGRTRSMDPFDARYTPIPIFLFFILFHSNLFLSVYFLSLSHHPPSIESFHGKISNVLARFFRSFLFHVHLFNEVFFLAPTVSFFFFLSLLMSLSEPGTKGECNFSSLRYFYDPLGTRVEKRPLILLSSLSHFYQPCILFLSLSLLYPFHPSFYFLAPFFFFSVLALFSLQTVVVPPPSVAVTVLVVVDDKIHRITGVKRFRTPRWATFISESVDGSSFVSA